MLTGVLLRLIFRSNSIPVVDAISLPILGSSEAILFHFNSHPSLDHYLGYLLRLVVDLLLGQRPVNILATILWTALAFVIIQLLSPGQPLPHRRRNHRSIRQAHARTYQPSSPIPRQTETELLELRLPSIIPPGTSPLESPQSPPAPVITSASVNHATVTYNGSTTLTSIHTSLANSPQNKSRLSTVPEEPSVEDETPLPVPLATSEYLSNMAALNVDDDYRAQPVDSYGSSRATQETGSIDPLSPLSLNPHKGFNGFGNLHGNQFSNVMGDNKVNAPLVSPSPSDVISEVTAGSNVQLDLRADQLREEARAEDQRCKELKKEYREACKQSKVKEAFLLKGSIKESEAKARMLHQKAAKRYYAARNPPDQARRSIDVHRLRLHEALKVIEEAFRRVLEQGENSLNVIVGKGLHSREGIPVLKPKVIEAMREQGIQCEEDEINPGILILWLSP
ncbi:hypothetical protein AX16_005202 [Volvariella volvacea WC 439]|nr:hypothetical protein AX16_005202 [Volvariella volvacea WC 439]